jgi:acyl dehydratase
VLYFEDFVVGLRRELGSRTLSADEIVGFAREYDPQPFHVDADAAARSPFGGLIASGWQTCGVAMRIMVEGYLLNSASMGSPGVDEVRWTKPVRPGDTLTVFSTVLEARVSRSKPDRGVIVSATEVVNQDGETVMTMRGMTMLATRPANA